MTVVHFDRDFVLVRHEVRRKEAAVKLHSSTTSTVVSLPRPSSIVINAILANLQKRVGQNTANRRVIVARNRGNLLYLAAALRVNRLRLLVDFVAHDFDSLGDARDKAIGSKPEAIIFKPSRKIASANTVAVVVPSPATSLVLLAASLTNCTPNSRTGHPIRCLQPPLPRPWSLWVSPSLCPKSHFCRGGKRYYEPHVPASSRQPIRVFLLRHQTPFVLPRDSSVYRSAAELMQKRQRRSPTMAFWGQRSDKSTYYCFNQATLWAIRMPKPQKDSSIE